MGGVNKENEFGHCRSQNRQLEDVQEINPIVNHLRFNIASGAQHERILLEPVMSFSPLQYEIVHRLYGKEIFFSKQHRRYDLHVLNI